MHDLGTINRLNDEKVQEYRNKSRNTSPKMQRRHYEFIAGVLANTRAPSARLDIILAIANAMQGTNPNFDKSKFLSARRYND